MNPTAADPFFRKAMSLLPTGVTVVTASGTDGPAGATANAVVSLSLEPPMMLACLDRGSRTLLAVQAADSFGVNVLSAGQENVARAFSTKAPAAEKWQNVASHDLSGVPAIDGSLVCVACSLRDVISGGDHVIVTGEVTGLESEDGEPLLFHRGAYLALGVRSPG